MKGNQMRARVPLALNAQGNGNSDGETGRAVAYLINMVRQVRSECAAIATCVVEPHTIDLRPLFTALHKVEETGVDRPSLKPVYTRGEVLKMTGWSRTTLWRRCDEIGFPGRKKAFTQAEVEKLVQWSDE